MVYIHPEEHLCHHHGIREERTVDLCHRSLDPGHREDRHDLCRHARRSQEDWYVWAPPRLASVNAIMLEERTNNLQIAALEDTIIQDQSLGDERRLRELHVRIPA